MEGSQSMVFLTDPICLNEEHLNFNAQILTLLREEVTELQWIGDKKYGDKLFGRSMPDAKETIDFRPSFSFVEAVRRYDYIFSSLARERNVRKIFFLSFDNTVFPLFCILWSRFLTGKSVVCIVHNNLKTLEQSRVKRALFRLLNKLVPVRYVVLTESMLDIANRVLATAKVSLLYHPFFDMPAKVVGANEKTFLVVGRQATRFVSDGHYETFLSACRQHPATLRIRLVLGLPRDSTIQLPSHNSPEVVVVYGFISGADYNTFFQTSNFFIFPDSEDAEYRASGTLMDSLSSGTVFIAPDNGHFRQFRGCGIFYKAGNLAEGITKALSATEHDIKELRKNIPARRAEYDSRNKFAIRELLL